jgi:5'-nucleotidase (lipoprotein e(P4) family)
MQAMFYQGYNIAKKSLLDKLKNTENNKPKAVILDIDETVLDNSPVEAMQIINNLPFSDSLWVSWIKKASAEPLPGALDFIKFSDSLGVEVFYVSNRNYKDEYLPTLINLSQKGLPFADSLHVILKRNISSKEIRRNSIEEKYDVVLLIGDNLADFDEVFDIRGEDLGFGAVKSNERRFGTDFIVLPNPMYGPWINSAIRNQDGINMRDKQVNALKSF